MYYKMINHGHFTVFQINEDRFDAKLAASFRKELEDKVGQISSHLVLDLSQVRFMDSSGLGAVIGIYKLLTGTKLSIVNPQRTVKELMRLTRMDRLISSYDTVEDAVAAVA